ncbi:pupal cuticle protein-like [Venturia canescens]|uniref:pupal cuticle protein-like n=1 Tax=Venturia canescens TaxID=32260 RepID=UPI001C9C9BFB|nr:pupal cuticle protein-like [Venturia canescens]
MIRTIILSAMIAITVAEPQWYGGPSYGAPAGYGGAAPLGPDGRVVDTPEVAQLKSAHLAALADANARAPKGPGADGAWNPAAGPANYAAPSYGAHYSGPPAPLGADGRVVDTPEVQQAKAVHFSLYNAEAQRAPAGPAEADSGAWNPAWNGGWNGAWDNHY